MNALLRALTDELDRSNTPAPAPITATERFYTPYPGPLAPAGTEYRWVRNWGWALFSTKRTDTH